MPDIFLSYNREDQARANFFAEAFQEQGFDVWWDVGLKTGEAYDQVTEKALREAKAVVVLWSKRSVESRWVRAEATLADRNRTLVPAMIEPCERPIMFELTQTAELSHWQGATDDRSWRAFLDDVKRFVEKEGVEAAEAPGPAPSAKDAAKSWKRGELPSLAVMPFINRSGVTEDDVFAEGMVEDIIAALSLGGGVRVLASSATVAYRKGTFDLAVAGRRLGTRYILEGNVRRAGSTLRVTAQLIEAETADILWTQRFDRPLAELADLQEDLVTDVAAHLGVQVQRIEMEKALRKPGNLTAWEAMVRSVAAAGRSGGDSIATTIAEAERAIAIAPDYGVAHACLALALGTRFAWQGSTDLDLASKARMHIDRALALDGQNPNVLWRAAQVLCLQGRVKEALVHAERAVEINPNMDTTQRSLALALVYVRPDEAIMHLDAADRLAPRGPFHHNSLTMRSVAYFKMGRLDDALEAVDAAHRHNPRFAFALVLRMLYLAKLARWDEARDVMRQFRDTGLGLSPKKLEFLINTGLWGQSDADAHIAAVNTLWNETQTHASAAQMTTLPRSD